MKITLKNSYYKNGNATFCYTIEGTKEELAAYKTIKGDYYREDEDKKPMFWSSFKHANGTELALKHDKSDYYAKEEIVENSVKKEMNKFLALNELENRGTKLNARLLRAIMSVDSE